MPLKCNWKKNLHSFVTCLSLLVQRCTALGFDSLLTLTRQFPLLNFSILSIFPRDAHWQMFLASSRPRSLCPASFPLSPCLFGSCLLSSHYVMFFVCICTNLHVCNYFSASLCPPPPLHVKYLLKSALCKFSPFHCCHAPPPLSHTSNHTRSLISRHARTYIQWPISNSLLSGP